MEAKTPNRCKARKRDGTPCMRYPLRGTTVCRLHGGSAPQVQRSARLRLLELVDPALSNLADILSRKNVLDADKIRACTAILDRAGYGPNSKLTVEQKGDLRPRVLDMLSNPPELQGESLEAIQVIHTLDTPALPAALQSLADGVESPVDTRNSTPQESLAGAGDSPAQALINRTLARA